MNILYKGNFLHTLIARTQTKASDSSTREFRNDHFGSASFQQALSHRNHAGAGTGEWDGGRYVRINLTHH